LALISVAKKTKIESGLIVNFAIALLGLVGIWEGILKAYNHYYSIWANLEPLDYFLAGLSIVMGVSLLISLKGLGRRPSYSFPLLGVIFGAFKIYTDIHDPGDVLVSMILISASLILLLNSFHLERKWIVTAVVESWLTILAWIVSMVTPTVFMWDYSLLFAWATLFFGISLWINKKGIFVVLPRREERLEIVRQTSEHSQSSFADQMNLSSFEKE
jgi:hypothetical protein